MAIRESTVEIMALNKSFWFGKKVFLTGHTGFKGTWTALWLTSLGAKVIGYSLNPPTNPSLFEITSTEKKIYKSTIADIRDLSRLSSEMDAAKPDIVIHMAAQPLVRDSYRNPVETYSTNVMGTVNILESIRLFGKSVKVFLNITTDKVYENKEWEWPYRENDRLGGFDPYSNSKGCSEMVTSSYRNSFFNSDKFNDHNLNIATVRAGNVIGGGDFAFDRLIPDLIRSITKNEVLKIRNPKAIRPWQHVLEPIRGYLRLIELMYDSRGGLNGAWNFGPNQSDAKSVIDIVKSLESMIRDYQKTNSNSILNIPKFEIDDSDHPHEANYLKLDISKVNSQLGWYPFWSLEISLSKIVEWTEAYLQKEDMYSFCLKQIEEYSEQCH